MRSYKAARRAAKKEPVMFAVDHEVERENDDGETELVEVQEVFTCVGEVSALTLSELAYNADVDIATTQGMALLRQFFMEAFGDEAEYQRFFKLRSQTAMDDDQLMEIMAGLVEDLMGRPTERPSTSPTTPSTTGLDSRVVSLPGGFTTQAQPVDPDLIEAARQRLSEAAVSSG